MSQQINLLLADLRPKRDWFSLPVIAVAGLTVFVVVLGAALLGLYRANGLSSEQQRLKAGLAGIEQQMTVLNQQLSARKQDESLQQRIEQLKESLAEHEEAVAFMQKGQPQDGMGYASMMRGFSRQIVDGAWLTGFVAYDGQIEIRGRLLDPALLPVFIRRLNGEAAFMGRQFITLDMQDGKDEPAKGADGGVAPSKSPRFTEFALRGNLPTTEGKSP